MNLLTNFKIVRILLYVFFIFLIPALATSQVRDIKSTAKSDHSSSYSGSGKSYHSGSSSYSDDSQSFGEMLFEGIIIGAFQGIAVGTVAAQKASLEKQPLFPERVSFEVNGLYGIDASKTSSLLSPSIRGNWGILGTDFRYSALDDKTGNLQNIDWQILMLRVPIKSLKLEYGLGFTHLVSPNNNWFESSVGFELGILQNKAVLKSAYRWTARKSLDERFRQEINCSFSYELGHQGIFHFSPVASYSYQSYYQKYFYNFIQLGIKVSIY